MLSQIDRNLFQKHDSRRAARQRRTRLVVGTLAGTLFSLGALTTLQAASESSGHLPVKQSVPGASSRLLAGVGTGGFAADALPYALLASTPKPAVEPAIEAAAPSVGTVPNAQAAAAAGEEAVRAAIEQWAKAWRSKDVAGYLAAYGEAFQPANGISRDDWAKLRQLRISDKREIQLELRDIEIQTKAADRVRVHFVQDYRADRFAERGTVKSMLLALEKDGWRILAEESAH